MHYVDLAQISNLRSGLATAWPLAYNLPIIFTYELVLMYPFTRSCMFAYENLIWMTIHSLNLDNVCWFLYFLSKTFVNNWPMLDHVQKQFAHFVSYTIILSLCP